MQNKNLIQSGIKSALGAIPLMFIGPILIHNAWMNKHTQVHYVVLGFGIIICLFSIFLMFKGIMKIIKGL